MLYQAYRPTKWTEFVGNPKAIETVRRIISAPRFDRGAFWIDASGANNSGVGKTTLAKLIAGELADDFFTTEYQGAKVNKSTVEDMDRSARLTTWSADKPFRVFIVNEAHAITQGAVDLFLDFLEGLPRHCVVIFTTTRRADVDLFGDSDTGAFGSRCHRITLSNQGLAPLFAERAREIAQAENLDGRPIASYVRLVQECKNNFRAVLQRIESGVML